jgi:hypothetical protein
MARSFWVLLFVVALVPFSLATRRARAQEPRASDKAAPEAQFNQGKSLLEAGQKAEACQKFQASQELDPGVGTQLFLGDCFERLGKTASAWATFLEAASSANSRGDRERERIARVRASALEHRLHRLSISAPAAAATEGFELRSDGSVVPRASWGASIPVDPGEHVLEAMAPGKLPFTTSIVIPGEPGETTVEIPPLEDAPVAAPTPAPVPTEAPMSGAPPPTGDSGTSGQALVGWVLGGAGVVGLAVGSVFGLRAMSDNDESLDSCRPNNPELCNEQGVSLREDAKDAATLSTVSFIVGGALIGGGVVLLLTAPDSTAERPAASAMTLRAAVAPGAAGVSLGGRF